MAYGSWLMQGFGLFLLASIGAASPWHQRSFDSLPTVFARQDDPAIEPPPCQVPCELNTCGSGSCGIAGFASLRKRSGDDLDSLLGSFASINVSNEHEVHARELSKRIWRFDPKSNTPVGEKPPLVEEVDKYLPAVFKGEEFDYFGNPLPLVHWISEEDKDERAYSQQKAFGNDAFQIMSGGVHGCTVVTLVSNRAVWMAHFWETYSHGRRMKDEPANDRQFEERIIDFILNKPVPSPTLGEDEKPYIPPTGPSPDPNLFNGNDDETKLYISTPIKLGTSLGGRSVRLHYPKRVERIVAAFQERIGRQPEYVPIPYQRLDYRRKEEKDLENKSHRGMHLFQYDPNSDNKGKDSWRLFSELAYKMKDVPEP